MTSTKFFLFFLAIAAMVQFTSCTDDITTHGAPTIDIVEPTSDTTMVYIGDSVKFTIDLSSENKLAKFQALTSTAGVEIDPSIKTFTNSTDETVTVYVKLTETVASNAQITITFTVTDDGKQASAQRVIIAKSKTTNLSAAKSFEWKRVGGTASTGLEAFGLAWTINKSTMVNAIINKGTADKFVELAPAAWSEITTKEALKAAVDAATAMTEWNKISVDASKTYNLTLGTKVGENYFLINVSNATVAVVGAGTIVTITGNYKE